MKKLFNSALIKVSKSEEIDLDNLAVLLNTYSFAVIRGIVDPDIIIKAKGKIKSLFNPELDNPATGEYPMEIMDNFQKLSIGGAGYSGIYRPRCMRTFYNPIWSDDIYGLRNVFKKVAELRNIIYGFKTDYAIDEIDNGFWTASRIHNYPAGGGFLVSHKDEVVPVVQKAGGISSYFQPLLIMSKKGKNKDCDFEKGGGFFEVNKIRYYYEEETNLGDVLIFSGATIHGVEDIDHHKTFNSLKCDGRFVGFVTLYKEFKRKNEIKNYASFSKKN